MLDDEQQDKCYVEELILEKFSQNELNDLVHDVDLSTELSELLASRLAEKNLLLPAVRISFYCNRHSMLLRYFSEECDFVL